MQPRCAPALILRHHLLTIRFPLSACCRIIAPEAGDHETESNANPAMRCGVGLSWAVGAWGVLFSFANWSFLLHRGWHAKSNPSEVSLPLYLAEEHFYFLVLSCDAPRQSHSHHRRSSEKRGSRHYVMARLSRLPLSLLRRSTVFGGRLRGNIQLPR